MFKGGISSGLLCLLTISELIVCGESSPQSLNDFAVSDHETLEWLFEAGLIDEDEYKAWDELLTDSIGGDRHPVDPPNDANAQEHHPSGHDGDIRLHYKASQNAVDSKPYRQTLRFCTNRARRFHCNAVLERSGDGHLQFRDRSIRWTDGDTRIELGGLCPDWCDGLVLGAHPVFLKEKVSGRSFLYPTMSRFNGAGLAIALKNVSMALVISYDKDARFSATVKGGQIGYKRDCISGSISFIRGRVGNTKSGKSADITVTGAKISAEIGEAIGRLSAAVDDDGDQAIILHASSRTKKHSAFVWHYKDSFLNPFGAGKANSDTSPIEIAEIDLTFRSRHKGESGVQTRSEFAFGRSHSLILESNWWRFGWNEKLRLKVSTEFPLYGHNPLNLVLLAGDDDLGAANNNFYSAIVGYRHRCSRRLQVTLSGHWRMMRTSRSSRDTYQVDGRALIHQPGHTAELLLRLYEPNTNRDRDHYLYCSYRESLDIDMRWRFAVLVCSRFGPEQNSLLWTRITIETTVRF